MRISDWSSDVCSSDLHYCIARHQRRYDMAVRQVRRKIIGAEHSHDAMRLVSHRGSCAHASFKPLLSCSFSIRGNVNFHLVVDAVDFRKRFPHGLAGFASNPVSELRSEEHTSELQSLMRISYDVF